MMRAFRCESGHLRTTTQHSIPVLIVHQPILDHSRPLFQRWIENNTYFFIEIMFRAPSHLYSIYLDLFHTVMPNVWWSDSRYWAQIKNHWIKSKQRHQEIEAEVSIPSVSVETNIYFGLFGENEIFCMTHEWSDTKHRDNKNRVNKKCDFSSAITRVHNMDFIFELH